MLFLDSSAFRVDIWASGSVPLRRLADRVAASIWRFVCWCMVLNSIVSMYVIVNITGYDVP